MKNEKRKGKLFVISGCSGVGKGTLLKVFLEKNPQIELSISATTRKPRPGEVDGVNYFFLTKEEFETALKNNEFLEWAEFNGKGAVVYLMNHEGRGIGIVNKIKAYALQDQGQDTVEANISLGFASDLREYGDGAQILLDLGFKKFKLITNNPQKIIGLEGYGLEIVERIQVESEFTKYNKRYLCTKVNKMHHLLNTAGMEQ